MEIIGTETEIVKLQNEIATINTELESDSTDVISELNKQIEYYQNLYLQTSDVEEKEKSIV